MFRLFFVFATVLVCAKDWIHYSGQNEIRDVVLADDGTLWAAFVWGLQERFANKENTYTPGNNNLEIADFVQIFALPGGDIIAASKNGNLVRKNKNSKNFETISNSFAEKKRVLLPGLGKIANNILILPFENALAFFDYEQKSSIITLSQINTSSLESSSIKRIAVENDSLWVELEGAIWKRKIDWNLADQSSWKPATEMPFAEKPKPQYIANSLNNLDLLRVRAISSYGNNTVAWGVDDKDDYFVRIRNGELGQRFLANPSDYPGAQLDPQSRSLALSPDGSFASGRWCAGLLIFDNNSQMSKWFHSRNTDDTCPTVWSNSAKDGCTIVQGVVPTPDFSGYIFSYLSETNYGLGFVDNNGKNHCIKPTTASSPVAFSIIARENEKKEWEIYVAWRSALGSEEGGVDVYTVTPSKDSKDFFPILKKEWTLPFGSPVNFAFDSKGILWAISNSKIFYLTQNEWKEPNYIRGFGGGIITALKTDAQNGLWIGTFGDGAYLLSQVNNSPDSLTAKHFKIKNGLLNEMVYDIAIDTIKGKVYFAHDLGLSVYSTSIVRSASNFMQSDAPKPIAYPNPFRPKQHNAVTIDYISEKSVVYIFDSSGRRVRFFNANELRGGAVAWDGKNESGKLVAPGLYHYMIKDGKKIAKGKIMVER